MTDKKLQQIFATLTRDIKPRRMAYLAAAATELVERLNQAVVAGDIGRKELAVVLVGAALASLRQAERGDVSTES